MVSRDALALLLRPEWESYRFVDHFYYIFDFLWLNQWSSETLILLYVIRAVHLGSSVFAPILLLLHCFIAICIYNDSCQKKKSCDKASRTVWIMMLSVQNVQHWSRQPTVIVNQPCNGQQTLGALCLRVHGCHDINSASLASHSTLFLDEYLLNITTFFASLWDTDHHQMSVW